MSIVMYFPPVQAFKYVKHPHHRDAYNKLMQLLRKLGNRSATDHPHAIYIPGTY